MGDVRHPEERRHGIGKTLLSSAVEQLRTIGDVEQIELTVVTSEHAARNLYRAAGFQVQGIVNHAMKRGDEYFDEETMVLWLVDARSNAKP